MRTTEPITGEPGPEEATPDTGGSVPAPAGGTAGPPARSGASLRPGYHSPQLDVEVRLNTNESAEPAPPRFFSELVAEIGTANLHRYPDRDATRLRTALAELHGVEPDQVFCANGSNEVLQSLLLAFGGPGRAAVTFEPTYALHSHIARLTSTAVVSGARDERFLIDLDEARATLGEAAGLYGPSNPAVCFLCSPNNPTGASEPRGTVEELARATPGVLVVDEAYGQFASWSALELLGAFPRIAVVRTFSKTWALAGLRLGYLVASPEVAAACSEVALPYHLDAVKQAAGRIAVGFEAEMRARVARTVERRGQLEAALGDLPVDTWPSEANFILFRARTASAPKVWQGLVDRSVLVRDVSAWPGLEGCLRVTVGTAEENERFVGALGEILAS